MTTISEQVSPCLYQEEFEALESKRLKSEYKEEFISEGELVKIFSPSSVIKENIIVNNEELSNIESEYKESLTGLMSDPEIRRDKERAEMSSLILWTSLFEDRKELAERNLKRLTRLKDIISRSRKKDSPIGITDEDIKRAKQYPIENYLQFDHAGFTKCLWHSEKTGSLKLYKKTNRVYCFGGCAKGYDVVDIVMKLRDLDFIKAVKFILNK